MEVLLSLALEAGNSEISRELSIKGKAAKVIRSYSHCLLTEISEGLVYDGFIPPKPINYIPPKCAQPNPCVWKKPGLLGV